MDEDFVENCCCVVMGLGTKANPEAPVDRKRIDVAAIEGRTIVSCVFEE